MFLKVIRAEKDLRARNIIYTPGSLIRTRSGLCFSDARCRQKYIYILYDEYNNTIIQHT